MEFLYSVHFQANFADFHLQVLNSNIESRKNRRKCRFLTHTYISFEKWRYEMVSNILSVVATTYQRTNDHTSGKYLSGISSGEFTRELDKKSLLN